MRVEIEPSWKEALSQEWNKEYFAKLVGFVKNRYGTSKVFPKGRDIFAAFNATPFEKVKVVIIGQDPYHGEGQANGLCFAVNQGVPLPPSLKNIFKEIENDLGYKPLPDGDLNRWANQGVLLLNSTLTVEEGRPGSHQGQGWETFTDAVIERLSSTRENIVFILWGSYAIKKGASIDRSKHLVLTSPHPSPLSAARGFYGNRHFSQANSYLEAHNISPVNWK